MALFQSSWIEVHLLAMCKYLFTQILEIKR
jgi:hypothetical protein